MNTEFVWTDKKRVSGHPCLKGHRFSLANLLAELSTGDRSLSEICEDFELEENIAIGALQDAICEICHMRNKHTETQY